MRAPGANVREHGCERYVPQHSHRYDAVPAARMDQIREMSGLSPQHTRASGGFPVLPDKSGVAGSIASDGNAAGSGAGRSAGPSRSFEDHGAGALPTAPEIQAVPLPVAHAPMLAGTLRFVAAVAPPTARSTARLPPGRCPDPLFRRRGTPALLRRQRCPLPRVVRRGMIALLLLWRFKAVTRAKSCMSSW